MKKIISTLLVSVFVVVGSIALAGNSGVSDPTITISKFTTQRNLKDVAQADIASLDVAVVAIIDVADGLIGGTTPMTSATVQGTLTAISTNGATTNVIITVDGVVDGATLEDGSVSDAKVVDTITASNYALLTQVWGSATVAGSENVKENTVTITCNDIAGSGVAGLRLLRIWASETDGGAASTNNIETLVLSTGTAVSTETAHADYYYVTAAAGTATAVITGTAAGTNWLMVADGSTVSSGAVVFE